MSDSTGDADGDSRLESEATGWGQFAIETLCSLGLLLLYSWRQSPLPGVNEPHYLIKARHYWQPNEIVGDFFLDSANTHLVFYQTFGLLTTTMTLPQAAIVGRVLGLAILAIGFATLTSQIVPKPGGTLLTLALFLAIATGGNWSGEWVVGGIESKVPSYGFGLAAVGVLLRGHLVTAGLLTGLATSFHPLVGGWLAILLVFAVVWDRRTDSGWLLRSGPRRAWLAAAGLWVMFALPGLWPAVQLIIGADPVEAAEATRIQVAERLPHHLDATHFARSDHRYFVTLVILWLLARPDVAAPKERFWQRLVWGGVFLAAIGALISLGSVLGEASPVAGLRLFLLKFYLFRLPDVVVPLAVAAAIAGRLLPRDGHAAIAVLIGAVVVSLFVPGVNVDAGRLNPGRQERWEDVCRVIRERTPEGSLCQTFGQAAAFKWYAERPEYFSFKDMPQDAASLLEWQRRRIEITSWPRNWANSRGFSQRALASLHERTGIDYLIVPASVPFQVDPMHRNSLYKIVPTEPPSEITLDDD